MAWRFENSSETKIAFGLWLRVLLWYGVISFFSSMPQHEVEPLVFKYDSGRFFNWHYIDLFLRKAAHLTEYGLLMVFVFRAVEKSWEKIFRWHFLLSLGLVIIFSVMDEWHQTFVFGRNGNAADVFIDTVGALTAYFVWLYQRTEMKLGIEKAVQAEPG